MYKEFYQTLKKPDFAPPAIVFRIVWPILYTLMTISLFLVIFSDGTLKYWGVFIFTLQLVFNLIWSPVFFIMQKPRIAFLISICLLISVAIMIVLFFYISFWAAILQIPYFLWLCFATLLNYSINKLNSELEE